MTSYNHRASSLKALFKQNSEGIPRVSDASIPAWAPKLCAQINEKQLRKNPINSYRMGQNLHCNCI